ncbi:MAG TPA: hypothetical protein PK313_08675, partial [Myxococcota bacterium]|nr:hypothetical protein [Myxococcota bacterium]
HLCTIKHEPKKFMDLIVCMNKDMRQIPNNFDACATETQVDAAKIKACADGQEGKDLLSASYKRSKEAKASGSPTMFLAGEKYQGGRQEMDFMRAICGKFTTKPEVCKDIPEPKKIPVIVLSDKRCAKCFPDRILGQLKGMFPGLEAKQLDYMDEEGKAVYAQVADKGGKYLPAFLFDPIVAEDPGYQQIARYMADAGQYKLLQLGSKFDPTAEICDNQADDDGNGKIDCDDDGCKAQLVCRTAIDKSLKVFVMSQCPFGVRAENAMIEVLDAFKDDGIDFDVHFIADELPDGTFKALHGQPEVDENIRQLCAIDLYPKNYKWFEYIKCRNKDIRSNEWKACATEAKMDAAAIEKCATGEKGKKLHSEDIKLAKALGIGASPTWLANNKFQFSGVAPEAIKKNFCAYNQALKGCAKTLSGDAAQGPAGGCGAN